MGILFVVPIEPLEERYSQQWLDWWQGYAHKTALKDTVLVMPKAECYQKINDGQFLDTIGTNAFKLAQLQMLVGFIRNGQCRNGDTIWFHDGWFPGVESLAYIRDLTTNHHLKFTAMFHAGSYDPWDYLAQRNTGPWAQHFETGWGYVYDQIFVATKYHKRLLCSRRHIAREKVRVVPFPFALPPSCGGRVCRNGRDPIIVFPHRLAPEKGLEALDIFRNLIRGYNMAHGTKWEVVRSKDVCKTKDDYYRLLKRATFSVSFAKQETWGIAMQESVFAGCIPIVPSRLSYKEMYPKRCQYHSGNCAERDADGAYRIFRKLAKFGHDYEQTSRRTEDMRDAIIRNGWRAFPTMLKYMFPNRKDFIQQYHWGAE